MQDKEVTVLIGAGSIGLAIARRISAGKHLVLADLKKDNAERATEDLAGAGFDVTSKIVDVTSRSSVEDLVKGATEFGPVTKVVLATGISPSHAPSELILKVDFYGTAVVLEAFGQVIEPGGSGLVVSSQAGHRLPSLTPEEDKLLATTPTDQLLDLPLLQGENIADPLYAYQLSKRGCSLRVKSEAVKWGQRGARVNAISPGIVITPLAKAELSGDHGDEYRQMIQACPVGRAGTPDEVASFGALLMGPEGGFVTGSDFLMDGGVTAAYWYGDLEAP